MVTGYTAPVAFGDVTEFKEFALLCARAFGALFDLKEEPLDVPIPEKFEPSSTNWESALLNEERVFWLRKLSPEEVEEEWLKDKSRRAKKREEHAAKVAKENERLRAMLRKVEAWEVPSPHHSGLKVFMKEQLEMSVASPTWEDA